MGHGSHSSHGSYSNHNQNHTSHGSYEDNQINYTDPNTGQAISISWEDAPQDLKDEMLENSIQSLVEIRNKIEMLQREKGWNTKENEGVLVPDNPQIDWSGADYEGYIEEVEYDKLVENLDNLFQSIKSTGSALSGKDVGQIIESGDFSDIKNKVDELAAYDCSAQYINHQNHLSHGSYEDHRSHGNHNSYTN